MTSHRKRKKSAASIGLSQRELMLAEMVEELLEQVRWLSVLGFGNQYTLRRKLEIDQAEQDRVLEAATRAVEQDQRFEQWRERLARIKGRVAELDRAMAADAASRRDPAGKASAAEGTDAG